MVLGSVTRTLKFYSIVQRKRGQFYCLTFKKIRSISDVINQSPGGFSGVNTSLFYKSATETEKNLAKRCLEGEYYYPATNALWFYAPSGSSSCKSTFYSQALEGRFKSHCFYKPSEGTCPELY